jgi:hypothetical protein
MPIDPRHNVLPGQRLRLAAEQVNGLNRLLRTNAGFGGGPVAEPERTSNIVLVRNDSGQDVPWLGVLQISGVVNNPTGGSLTGSDAASSVARDFAVRPVMTGVMPAADFFGIVPQQFAVAVEPIAAGAVGRMAVGGAFACRLLALDAKHKFAVAKSGDVTQLQSAKCGPLRILWPASLPVGPHKYAVVVA